MKRYRVNIGDQTYEVEVEDIHRRPVVARIGGETFLVEVDSERASRSPGASASQASGSVRATAPAATHAETHILSAPIPGVIISVAVVAGQAVERGDPLLTIEAMKMFNVVRSPRAGTIASVHVVELAQISQGDPLVTFVS